MDIEQQLREVNEALLISSVRQHELTEQAQRVAIALRASEERFRTLFELGPVAVYSCDAAGRIIEFNRRAVELWGRTPALGDNDERFCGSFRMILPDGSDLAREQCPMAHVLSGAIPQAHDAEACIERPDGSRITVVINICSLKNDEGVITGAIGCFHDITERQRTVTELKATSDLLRAVADGIPDAVFVKDREGRYLLFNRAAAEFVGRQIDEVLGHDDTELFGPSDARRVMERDQRVMTTGQIETEEEILTAAGVTRTYLATKAPYRDGLGNIAGVMGISRDITEQKQAEEVLQLRDRAIQAVTQGILITDPDQRDNPIIYASPGFERLTGYASDEVLGRNCRFLQGPDSDPETVIKIRKAVRESRPLNVEILNYRKDGASFWNELSISPVLDADGQLTHFVGTAIDISQRRQLEEQLRQSQKLEAIGQLAGGVAHDFNNLLTVILGYSDMLLDSPPPEERVRGLLEEIKRAGERAAGLTNQLLLFGRKQVQTVTILDLNDVAHHTKKMLSRVIGEDIRLITNLNPTLGSVKADAGQIEQILLNLAVNARDAMPDGGKIVIETNNVNVDEEYAASHPSLHPGFYVMLTVIDTGEGISEDVREHIFEPFFTTKEVGKGTGLGLPVVHSVVKHSGGHIEIESKPGKGAAFRIYLPRVEHEPAADIAQVVRSAPSGAERILLVEDEASVSAIGQLILEECGYTVFRAQNAEEALAVCASLPSPIQLLVTDVVLPGLNGRQLAERIVPLFPQVKVLYVSGYMDDDVIRRGVAQRGMAFLQKPYSRTTLTTKVREVLDAK